MRRSSSREQKNSFTKSRRHLFMSLLYYGSCGSHYRQEIMEASAGCASILINLLPGMPQILHFSGTAFQYCRRRGTGRDISSVLSRLSNASLKAGHGLLQLSGQCKRGHRCPVALGFSRFIKAGTYPCTHMFRPQRHP